MRKALLIVFMLVSVTLAAQPALPKKAVPDLEFAHFDRNKLNMTGDAGALDKFFHKMDSVRLLEDGKISILYMGGSHVQGGYLTRELRNDFLELEWIGDGGRGLVFPFAAAHTNTPASYSSGYEGDWTVTKDTQRDPQTRLGLTGMAVTTSSNSSNVTITLKPRSTEEEGDFPFLFSDVRVLGYATGGDRRPVILLPSGDALFPEYKENQDSVWLFHMPAPVNSVRIGVTGTSGSFTLTGAFLDNEDYGLTVNEVGVNGASLHSYSQCLDWQRDLRCYSPDLAVFAIGINDAVALDFSPEVFKQRYKALIAKIREVNPDCCLLFVTNNDSFRHARRKGYYVNTNGALAEKAFLELGKECGAAVWDLYDIMGGEGSMQKWEEAGLAQHDKVHFTEKGYTLVGDLLYNALTAQYREYIRRRK